MLKPLFETQSQFQVRERKAGLCRVKVSELLIFKVYSRTTGTHGRGSLLPNGMVNSYPACSGLKCSRRAGHVSLPPNKDGHRRGRKPEREWDLAIAGLPSHGAEMPLAGQQRASACRRVWLGSGHQVTPGNNNDTCEGTSTDPLMDKLS